MNQLIRFLFKEKIYFLIACIIVSVFAIKYGGIWHIVPYIFLLFFFYDWNVSSKINKTWLYLETLPVSLFKRYILRVIFPFVFCFIILYCLEVFKHTGEIDTVKSIIDAFRQTSIFVLSSILASSLGGYIFLIIVFNLVLASLSFFHFYIICVFIFTFLYTYYFLSKKRVSKTKFIYLPFVAYILILVCGNYFRGPTYELFLSIPIKSIQVYSAQTLIQDGALEYHYDDTLLQKIETLVVTGDSCSLSCYELARAVENFPQKWDLERLSSYLNSGKISKQIYALEILRASRKMLFLNRVLQLAQSENPDVGHEAVVVLNNWGIRSLYDIPRTDVF